MIVECHQAESLVHPLSRIALRAKLDWLVHHLLLSLYLPNSSTLKCAFERAQILEFNCHVALSLTGKNEYSKLDTHCLFRPG